MINLQNILVGLLVLAASAYVVRVLWRTLKGKPTCGCGSAHCADGARPMGRSSTPVQINPTTKPSK